MLFVDLENFGHEKEAEEEMEEEKADAVVEDATLEDKIQIHSRITHLRSYLTGKFYMLANILYFTISIWYGGRV
jgi:negative regulator of genetic competence, sporulation and motility